MAAMYFLLVNDVKGDQNGLQTGLEDSFREGGGGTRSKLSGNSSLVRFLLYLLIDHPVFQGTETLKRFKLKRGNPETRFPLRLFNPFEAAFFQSNVYKSGLGPS